MSSHLDDANSTKQSFFTHLVPKQRCRGSAVAGRRRTPRRPAHGSRHDRIFRAGLSLSLALIIGSLTIFLPQAVAQVAQHSELRVCADPNNLPFSNEHGEGFENKIAELLARDQKADLRYTWWAQRRGFVRNTLKAGLCDVIIGVPSSFELALTSRPYYRSSYVFVQREGDARSVNSFDEPALRTLKVGVHLVGDDATNTPPAHALSARGIVSNVVGYTLYGDYGTPNPPARLIDAVADGTLDVAVAWGPLAGYFAARHSPPLTVKPVSPEIDLPFLPFVFDISMGVRRGENDLKERLDQFLLRQAPAIHEILVRYGVPLTGPQPIPSGAV